MAGPIVISIEGNNRGLDAAVGSTQGKLGKLGSVAAGVGKAVAAGLVVAGAGAVAFGVKAVQAASAAEQSLGATQTVFGKFADTVVGHSKRADTQLGLSANQYRENANLIGSLFRNQGVAADQLAGKTRSMIKTGADLAATFGGTTTEAVEALGSAFKGEFDPLERYGISIKQSAINAELAAKGQDKLTGAALKTAQQQATTRLIMEQSSRSQGAFARESNTLAHVQQVLGAQFENLKAKAGGALTPSLVKLGKAVSTNVMPALSQLVDKYGPQVAAFLDKATAKLPGLINSLTSGKGGGGQFAEIGASLEKLSPTVTELVGALPSFSDVLNVAGVALSFAADNTDKLAAAMPFLAAGYVAVKVGQLASNAAAVLAIPVKITEVAVNRQLVASNRALIAARAGDTTATATNTAAQSGGILARTRAVVATVAHRVATVASAAASKAAAGAQWLLNAALAANPIGLIIVAVAGLAIGLTLLWKKSETFRKIVTGAWNAIKAATSAVFGAVKRVITTTWNAVSGAVKGAVSGIKSVITGAWNAIKSASSAVWNGIKAVISGAIRVVATVVRTYVNIAKAVLTGAWNAIRSVTTAVWNKISGVVKNAISNVVSVVRSVPGKIKDVFAGAGRMLWDIGKSIIDGLVNGIKAAAGAVADAARAIVDKIPGPIKKAMGIFSPSRVMHKIGQQITQGLVNGLREGTEIESVITDIGKKLQEAFKKVTGKKLTDSALRVFMSARRTELNALRDLAAGYQLATEKLTKARELAGQLKDAATDYGSIVSAGVFGEDGQTTAGSITQGLTERLAAIVAFRDKIEQLRKAGLNTQSISEIMAAGIEQGSATAAAILAKPDSIIEVNYLQSQIASSASQLGDTGAVAMFGSAQQTAAGFLDGLQSQTRLIELQAEAMGDRIVRAFQRGIRRRGRGLRRSAYAQIDFSNFDIGAAMRAAERAQLTEAAIASGFAPSAGGTVTVQLTAEQLSAVQRGREIQIDLDAYAAAGGRAAS